MSKTEVVLHGYSVEQSLDPKANIRSMIIALGDLLTYAGHYLIRHSDEEDPILPHSLYLTHKTEGWDSQFTLRLNTEKENTMNNTTLGPNTRKLLSHFIALEAIPKGGGIASGIEFLTNPERREQGIKQALSNLDAALAVVKLSPDNPYGDDNEAIAAAILERIEQQKEHNKK